MSTANHRVRESCLICEGTGRAQEGPCAYCSGSGIVYSRTGAEREILLATGDCKVPLVKRSANAQKQYKN